MKAPFILMHEVFCLAVQTILQTIFLVKKPWMMDLHSKGPIIGTYLLVTLKVIGQINKASVLTPKKVESYWECNHLKCHRRIVKNGKSEVIPLIEPIKVLFLKKMPAAVNQLAFNLCKISWELGWLQTTLIYNFQEAKHHCKHLSCYLNTSHHCNLSDKTACPAHL